MLSESILWYDKDKVRMFQLLRDAYEQRYSAAIVSLAKCYHSGRGTGVNKHKAFELYEIAAKDGIMEAQEKLCEAYFRGDGVAKNYKLCAELGLKAIEQGSKSIRFETAFSLAEIGRTDEARRLYTELANEGNAASMNNLGCLETDTVTKASWFQKSADKGEEYGMLNIGRFYRDGKGVEQNYTTAFSYFKNASEKGLELAMFELAEMYRRGLGVEKDPDTMVEWYKKAIEKDDIDSMMRLAYCYRYGDVVKKDILLAIHYYKIAAEHEHVEACYLLGDIYENEIFMDRNLNKAIFWYRKAARKDHNRAQKRLVELDANWLDDENE